MSDESAPEGREGPSGRIRGAVPSVESAFVTLGVLALVVVVLAGVRGMPEISGTASVDSDGPGFVVDDGDAPAAGRQGEEGTADQFVTETVGGGGPGGSTGETRSGDGAEASATGPSQSGPTGGGGEAAAAACEAGQNGGETDVGVSASSIKLGATVVESGIGASFLGPVRLGMQAVANRVNDDGGICGRTLDLVLKDDGWDRQRGRGFIQNLVEDEDVFALAVVPSTEGLDAAADYLDSREVPVVGTDGLLASQYTHEWFWPVATSTLSMMHVIAQDAYERGARDFSIVYDRRFRFGLEGAFAFNQAVKRLTGSDIPGYSDPFSSPRCAERFCGIQAGESGYNTEARELDTACSSGITGGGEPCDFNALLLEPSEAITWYNSGGPAASEFIARGIGAGAAQPLFTRDFAINCQDPCDGLVVWTGFNPPIERFASRPGVAQYADAVRAQSANADINNQFLEGGYLGMLLLVEALDAAGPNLTRASLRAALDTLTLDTGLTRPLHWGDGKFANTAAQGFQINYSGRFNGWTEYTDDWVEDRWVGEDIRA